MGISETDRAKIGYLRDIARTLYREGKLHILNILVGEELISNKKYVEELKKLGAEVNIKLEEKDGGNKD